MGRLPIKNVHLWAPRVSMTNTTLSEQMCRHSCAENNISPGENVDFDHLHFKINTNVLLAGWKAGRWSSRGTARLWDCMRAQALPSP